jgi:hypothetical protein
MPAHVLIPPRPGAPDPLFLPDLGTAFCRQIAVLLPATHPLRAPVQAVANRDLEEAQAEDLFGGWEYDPLRAAALAEALSGLGTADILTDAWDWLSPRLEAFRANTRSFPGDLPGMEPWKTEMARMQRAVDAARAGRRDPEDLSLLGRRLPTLWS